MAIENGGRYECRAIGPVIIGESKEKKTPFVEFNYKIETGPNSGGVLKFTGYFSEKTMERTFEAMRTSGWEGDDLAEFADNELHGLGKNLVSVQAELEEYVNKEGRKAITARAAWVNPLGYIDTKRAMSTSSLSSLSERLRAASLASKTKAEASSEPDPWEEQPKGEEGKTAKGKKK